MKVEFVKRTDMDSVYYYTKVDDIMVSDSFKSDMVEAAKLFEWVCTHDGKLTVHEIIETREI